MVRTSLANAGSEEISSPSLPSCTFSLDASCRTLSATWGNGGIRKCAQEISTVSFSSA